MSDNNEITNDKSVKVILAILLVLTVGLLVLQTFAFNRSLEIDANSAFTFEVIDDQTRGGNSIAELNKQGSDLIFKCQVKAGVKWPFCKLRIDLRQIDKQGATGVDLSKFENFRLWLKSNKDSGIRIHLRNFNSRYSKSNDEPSLKYNTIEVFGINAPYPITATMNSFQVSTWWLVENAMPLENIAPEFNDVHYLELATPSVIAEGEYTFTLEKIEFTGKLVSAQTLYLMIIMVWMATAIVYLLRSRWVYLKTLKTTQKRQLELEAINRLLNFKSRQLEIQISHDDLTGVLNRDGIEKVLYEAIEVRRNSSGLCVVLMNLDHFHDINEQYGRDTSDRILRQFSILIEGQIRKTDVFSRWGGDEFLLLCPDTGTAEVHALADKLRQKVEMDYWPQGLSVTCSFGVTQMHNESLEELLLRADRALQKAKAAGRNTVVACPATKEDKKKPRISLVPA